MRSVSMNAGPRASRPRFVTTVHGLNSVGFYSAVMLRGERVICVSQTVRDYVLRQQLDAIRKELGETPDEGAEVDRLRDRIEAAGMPEDALKQARRELDRLGNTPAASAEHGVIRTYLEWMVDLPWSMLSEGASTSSLSTMSVLIVSCEWRAASRRTTFSSSRTLPGQLCRFNRSMAAISIDFWPSPSRAAWRRKWRTRSPMSSSRSRSGGMRSGTTLRR